MAEKIYLVKKCKSYMKCSPGSRRCWRSFTVHHQQGALTHNLYRISQGLLLMIPNMYKIAGELFTWVFHTFHAWFSWTRLKHIWRSPRRVMATRQTGFALLASGSVQEVMDSPQVWHIFQLREEYHSYISSMDLELAMKFKR